MTHLRPLEPPPLRPRPRPHLGAAVGAIVIAGIVGFLGGGLLGALGVGVPEPARVLPAVVNPEDSSPSQPPASPDGAETTAVASISLEADKTSAGRNERIRLTGVTSPPTGGVTLQVQRSLDGGPFQQFPVTAETNLEGRFSTAVATQQTGENAFRMAGEIEGRAVASNTVIVTIR